MKKSFVSLLVVLAILLFAFGQTASAISITKNGGTVFFDDFEGVYPTSIHGNDPTPLSETVVWDPDNWIATAPLYTYAPVAQTGTWALNNLANVFEVIDSDSWGASTPGAAFLGDQYAKLFYHYDAHWVGPNGDMGNCTAQDNWAQVDASTTFAPGDEVQISFMFYHENLQVKPDYENGNNRAMARSFMFDSWNGYLNFGFTYEDQAGELVPTGYGFFDHAWNPNSDTTTEPDNWYRVDIRASIGAFTYDLAIGDAGSSAAPEAGDWIPVALANVPATAFSFADSLIAINGAGGSTIGCTYFDSTYALPPPAIGDANNDGLIDGADALIVAEHWLQTDIGGGYRVGDFNGDRTVDDRDATLMAANWNPTGSGGAAAVPEPSTMALLLAGLIGLSAYVSRNKK